MLRLTDAVGTRQLAESTSCLLLSVYWDAKPQRKSPFSRPSRFFDAVKCSTPHPSRNGPAWHRLRWAVGVVEGW
jgi:hypothetical protein